jgi:hypothetical protein
MTDIREKRAAEIQDSIRQVLRHDWNPIGFGDVLPEDEYTATSHRFTGFWLAVGPRRSLSRVFIAWAMTS